MVEFYQAYTDYRGVMDLTQKLLEQAAIDVTGGTKTTWGETVIDWAESNWTRMTMREAIIHYWPDEAGPKPDMTAFADAEAFIRFLKVSEVVLATAREHVPLFPKEERAEARVLGTTLRVIVRELEASKNVGKAIAHVFEATAEEHLIQPTIIYEFPAAVSPLSKQKADDPDWVERWEIFVGKMEIANGFSELNDPEEQRRRFEAQLTERERGDDEAHQMDEDYIRALSYGMPPAGGVGVGVDRLAMLLTDSHTIRDVILFPLLRPEKLSTAENGETAE
jgi:lysyl-tRNA synthetase class 2